MAITRAQQYKQMLQNGGRIGLKPGGPPGGGDPGMKYNAPNPRENRRGGQYTSPEAKAVVTRQELKDIVNQIENDKKEELVEVFRNRTGPFDKIKNFIPYVGLISRFVPNTRNFLLDKVIDAKKGVFDPNNPNYLGDIYSMSPQEQEELLSEYNRMRGMGEIDAYGRKIEPRDGPDEIIIPEFAQAPSTMDQIDKETLTPVQQAIADRGIARAFVAKGGRAGFRSAGAVSAAYGDAAAKVGPVERPGGGRGDGPSGPPRVINPPPQTNPIVEKLQKRNIPDDSPFKKFLDHDKFTDYMKILKTPNYHQMGGFDFMARFPNMNPDTAKMLASAYQNIFEVGRAIADGSGGITIGDALDTAKKEAALNAIGIDAFSDPTSEIYKQYTDPSSGVTDVAVSMAEGGMPYEGGIMDLESARQMYGLGKLVKKVTRGIKKIAKSPIGKAALLYTGLGGLGNLAAGQSFFSNFASPKTFLGGAGNIFKSGGLKNILVGRPESIISPGGKDIFRQAATKGILGTGGQLSAGKLITAASLLPLFGIGTGEEDEEQAEELLRGEGIDIAAIRANPNQYLATRFAAEGGIMRQQYQEGSKEPVAKKTMPLLDMGGMEKDYREDGGFVPIGRMEKADDVPARLSKNEFVFTADAVRNAGDGDVDKGAEVMYNMMKNLEAGGDVSEESQGLEGAREMFQTSRRLEEVL